MTCHLFFLMRPVRFFIVIPPPPNGKVVLSVGAGRPALRPLAVRPRATQETKGWKEQKETLSLSLRAHFGSADTLGAHRGARYAVTAVAFVVAASWGPVLRSGPAAEQSRADGLGLTIPKR